MSIQHSRAEVFRTLHRSEGAFLIPNPWDRGSARLLQQLGFKALATTSAGYSFSCGKPDYALSREEMLRHAAGIVRAVDLPVSADLQNGFGDAPEAVQETLRQAADTGLVGGSIEDATGNPGQPLYELEHAVERIVAAVETCAAMEFPFTLTARAENFLVGQPDLDDTIRRLQAYQQAGADVLYAPGIRTAGQIRSIIAAIDKPLNVVMGIRGVSLTLQDLAELGVRRVSIGSALSRVAYTAFFAAATEMLEHGSFTFSEDIIEYQALCNMFARTRAD